MDNSCAACTGPQYGYRNGTMYFQLHCRQFRPRNSSSAEKHSVNFEGALTWAFEFETNPISRDSARSPATVSISRCSIS